MLQRDGVLVGNYSNRAVNIFGVTDPAEVKLHVDGSSDKCSKGEDIDFLFTGFAIFGQVACVHTRTYYTHTHTHARTHYIICILHMNTRVTH